MYKFSLKITIAHQFWAFNYIYFIKWVAKRYKAHINFVQNITNLEHRIITCSGGQTTPFTDHLFKKK